MDCKLLLQSDSLKLETGLLSFGFGYTLVMTCLSGMDTLFSIGMVLLIMACAYGIPVSNDTGAYARKFALCAAIAASLSAIVLTIRYILFILLSLSEDPNFFRHFRTPAFAISFFIGFGIYLAVVVSAGLTAVKHIKNWKNLPRNCNLVPSTMEISGIRSTPYPQTASYYNNQPAMQPLVGHPAYV